MQTRDNTPIPLARPWNPDPRSPVTSTPAQPPTEPHGNRGSGGAGPESEDATHLPWMVRLTAICLAALALGWIVEGFYPSWPWVWGSLYVIAFLSGGYYSARAMASSLLARQFDVNSLMVLAALGAAAVGQAREGAILIFLFALAQALESYAMGRTYASIHALLDLSPREAEVQRNGEFAIVPVEDLVVGDVVMVRPGAKVPADAMVLKGASAVDESSITGESLPVEKGPGLRVFAGTMNGQGALEARVLTPVEDSTLSRIVQVVREAREQKARSQDFTDRVVGQYYAWAVVAVTLLAVLVPMVLHGQSLGAAVYRAMTIMVVASPCALVISIPAALLSALARSARSGTLFKGGRHLETMARVRVVAFDKTGTLTTGRPGVVDVCPLPGLDLLPEVPGAAPPADAVAPPDDHLGPLSGEQARALALAAAVETPSEHPLARAIVRSATERGLNVPEASDFAAFIGAGAEAVVEGRSLRIGRPSLFAPLEPDVAALVHARERQGCSVVLIGDERPAALIAIADTARPEAAAAVAALKRLGVRRVVLLTGDNRNAAETIGHAMGVDEVRAELLPHEKVDVIRSLQAEYGPVAMVGDGVNDAPALATAALGVAMGAAGADVALESADVLLMGDDLSHLPDALRLARRARRVVRQNLTFAFTVMAALVILALNGRIGLPLGVIGHEGSTLIVVLNGLRLLFDAPR